MLVETQKKRKKEKKSHNCMKAKAISTMQSFWKSNFQLCFAPETVDARLFDVFRAAAQMPQP